MLQMNFNKYVSITGGSSCGGSTQEDRFPVAPAGLKTCAAASMTEGAELSFLFLGLPYILLIKTPMFSKYRLIAQII